MATGDYSVCSLTHGHEHEHEHEILRTTHARAAAASGCKMVGESPTGGVSSSERVQRARRRGEAAPVGRA